MFKLTEDRKSTERIFQYLEDKVVSHKNHKDYNKYVKTILGFYKQYINPWRDKFFLENSEIERWEEKELTNIVLDFCNTLDKIFR